MHTHMATQEGVRNTLREDRSPGSPRPVWPRTRPEPGLGGARPCAGLEQPGAGSDAKRVRPSPVSPLHRCRAVVGVPLALRPLRGKETSPQPRLPSPPWLCDRAFSPAPLRPLARSLPPSFGPSSLPGSLLDPCAPSPSRGRARSPGGSRSGSRSGHSATAQAAAAGPGPGACGVPTRAAPAPLLTRGSEQHARPLPAGLSPGPGPAAERARPRPRPQRQRRRRRQRWRRQAGWVRRTRLVEPPSCVLSAPAPPPAGAAAPARSPAGLPPAWGGQTDGQPLPGSRTDGRRCRRGGDGGGGWAGAVARRGRHAIGD